MPSIEVEMQAKRDELLLRRFQLCRADVVTALGASSRPPHPQSLRFLADLQLAIMATEATISDKADARFFSEYLEGVAA
jgi:hypothetical protein